MTYEERQILREKALALAKQKGFNENFLIQQIIESLENEILKQGEE